MGDKHEQAYRDRLLSGGVALVVIDKEKDFVAAAADTVAVIRSKTPVIYQAAYDLPNDRFELLYYACVWHTEGKHHDDPTIATCWDADRLDLGRVGIVPHPDFMSTDFGRQIAAYGSIEPFFQSTERPTRDPRR